MQMLISRNSKKLLEKHRKWLIPKVFVLFWYTANRHPASDSQIFISSSLETSPSFQLLATSLSSTLQWIILSGFGFGLLMHKDCLPLGGTPQQASVSELKHPKRKQPIHPKSTAPALSPDFSFLADRVAQPSCVPVFTPASQPLTNFHPPK